MTADALAGAVPPSGELAAFEEPKDPDLVPQTDPLSVEESVERIVALMESRGFLG